MKTQSDLHLYLLKKVHGWCKRQGMTDPECTSNAHSGNFSGDMVCSSPRLRPETISMVVIILSPSHPFRVRKYSVVQNQNWNQYSTYTFLPWIISNMRI